MVEQIREVYLDCPPSSGYANHLAFGTDNHKIRIETNQIILLNCTLTSESPFNLQLLQPRLEQVIFGQGL
jgi:hypothetical protein